MTWVKLDDGFAEHPKIDALSSDAFRLYVAGLCHCARQLTDGAITDARITRLVPRYRPKHRAELVNAGLWDSTEGGILVHDYLAYQPSRAAVLAERENNADRQRRWRESQGTNGVRNGVTNGERSASVTGAPTRPDPAPTGPESVVELSSSSGPPAAPPTAAGSPLQGQELEAALAGIAQAKAAATKGRP